MDPFLILGLKFVALFVGIAYGVAVFGRIVGAKQDVSQTQIFSFSFGAAAFITLQWLL